MLITMVTILLDHVAVTTWITHKASLQVVLMY